MGSWVGLLLVICCHLLLFQFSSSHSLCHPHDSFALLQFKASFMIYPDYYECENVYPKIETWKNGTDCCSWFGVTCHPISGHVIGLDLTCRELHGEIHPNSTLFRLSHLQSLNLAFNDFSGSQLSSLFDGFVSLTHLNLSNSYFKGEIPSQISHLSKLQSLDLSFNELKWKESTWKNLLRNTTVLREIVLDETDMSLTSIGPLNLSSSLVSLRGMGVRWNLANDIPCLPNLQRLDLSLNYVLPYQQLPNLSCSAASLNILDLSGCNFKGSIPPVYFNLTHLVSLDLSWNFLDGSVPSSLLILSRLTSLHLGHNDLKGQIPNVFHQSNKLEELDLSFNNIGGELPSTLSNLQHLIFLDLSRNKISGQIPDMFVGLTKLNALNLKNNNLGGKIPSSLFDLTQLDWVDFSNNKLEGPLPNKITGFSNLTDLQFSNNLLNGTIPSWSLSLPSLIFLNVSNNQFTLMGHISAISSSYSLRYLNLCNNKLQGNIPESIFSLVNLTFLCLSSNNLIGPVNFSLFSKLQNLEELYLSHFNHLSLKFESSVNYSLSSLLNLELSSLGLTEFPELSGKVPVLQELDMSNNILDGRVPNWLHQMDSLSFLNLSQNLLATPMDQFSTNYQLHFLDLSFNLISDGISTSLCNASFIEILNLSHNRLTGIIPQCLGNLSSLKVLHLQNNKLHGTLPNTFSNCYSLSSLNLYDNQLEGLLPESLSNCTQLELLNLGNNQIVDTFPHWLHILSHLKVLVLRANKFHGAISILKTKPILPNLIIFDISDNNFSGSLPIAYIENFKAMKNYAGIESNWQYMHQVGSSFRGRYILFDTQSYDSMVVTMKGINMTFTRIPTIFTIIDLSGNNFEGEIPNVIGDLDALIGLNLSHNKLSGSIPQSMGNLKSLEWLDLSSNMLIGRIPLELTNLNYLEVLNLAQNNLAGEIPQGKQFNTFSNDSYEGNLGLCGSPLSIKCNMIPEQHPPYLKSFGGEQKFEFGWKPVAIGYGCGMIFGVGLGCCAMLVGKPKWFAKIVGPEHI